MRCERHYILPESHISSIPFTEKSCGCRKPRAARQANRYLTTLASGTLDAVSHPQPNAEIIIFLKWEQGAHTVVISMPRSVVTCHFFKVRQDCLVLGHTDFWCQCRGIICSTRSDTIAPAEIGCPRRADRVPGSRRDTQTQRK